MNGHEKKALQSKVLKLQSSWFTGDKFESDALSLDMEYRQATPWSGRVDAIDGKAGNRWHQVMNYLDLSEPLQSGWGYAFLGFVCDEGVRLNQGRTGAAQGPAALRRAMSNLPSHQNFPLYDAGDVICYEGELPLAQQFLAQKVAQLLNSEYFPILLGGGHETAFGHYLGHALLGSFPAIINLDAHFDLRLDEQGANSGTPFYQIYRLCLNHDRPFRYYCMGVEPLANTPALYQRAKALGVRFSHSPDTDMISEFLPAGVSVFLSLDLDVIGSAFAPGVSAPNPFGLKPEEVKDFLLWVRQRYYVVGLEVVELNPTFDVDERTAKLAAWLIASFMGITGN